MTEINCVDLREICKKRHWRYRYDLSKSADKVGTSNPESVWYVEIPCKYGIIYPVSRNVADAVCEGHGKILSKLKSIPSVAHLSHGIAFDISLIDKIAEIMQPRKKRFVILTEEQKNVLRDRLAAARTRICKTHLVVRG
jgi:hypothetical protein